MQVCSRLSLLSAHLPERHGSYLHQTHLFKHSFRFRQTLPRFRSVSASQMQSVSGRQGSCLVPDPLLHPEAQRALATSGKLFGCASHRYDLSLGGMSAALHQVNHTHMPALGGGYLGLGQGLNLGSAEDLTRQPMAALMQRLGFWPQPQQQQAQQQHQALQGLGQGHSLGMHAHPNHALAHADLQLKADALQQQQQHAAEEEAAAMRRQLHQQQLQQYHAALEQQAAIQQQLQVRRLGPWPDNGMTVSKYATIE